MNSLLLACQLVPFLAAAWFWIGWKPVSRFARAVRYGMLVNIIVLPMVGLDIYRLLTGQRSLLGYGLVTGVVLTLLLAALVYPFLRSSPTHDETA